MLRIAGTALKEVIQRWLAPSSLPVIVYEKYMAGVAVDEGIAGG